MPELVMPSLETARPTAKEPATLADGPLFVVGIWRSGTSLLYALLNQHPQIALMYEDDLVFLRPLFWVRRKTSNWLTKWDFFNGAITRHKVDSSRIPENIHDLKTALESVQREYCRQKKGGAIWGSKSPTYFDLLSDLASTFPNARFIIIWRDLTSICQSIAKAGEERTFFSRKGIMLRALLGYRKLKRDCDWLLQRGFPVHQVHYEDLVSEPTAVMKSICDFLRIPFDSRMTMLEGADRSAIEEADHHSLVKSKEIHGFRRNPESLSPVLKAKIERYISLWRKQENGSWPMYPVSLEAIQDTPSIPERAWDWIRYRVLSLWYFIIPLAYSFVPLPVWESYRRLTNRSFSWQKKKTSPSES
jgi:hypothetical protein